LGVAKTQEVDREVAVCAEIFTRSYWLHAELEKIFKKFYVKK
jgi:hypothetical protein